MKNLKNLYKKKNMSFKAMLTFIVFIGNSMSLSGNYPYAEPHRFSNHAVTDGTYALKGLNFLNFPSGRNFGFIAGSYKNQSIKQGGFLDIEIGKKDETKKEKIKNLIMINNNDHFSLTDNRGNKGLIARKQDQIIFYLYKNNANSMIN